MLNDLFDLVSRVQEKLDKAAHREHEEGERLKAEGQARVLENEGRSPWWREATGAIRYVAERKRTFTIEDAEEITGMSPHHPNAWGGLMQWAVAQRICQPTGQYRQAERPSSRARPIRVWESMVYKAPCGTRE